MRMMIRAVGRAAGSEEGVLAERYRERAAQFGRGLGVTSVTVQDISESRSKSAGERKTAEAAALLDRLPGRCHLVVLDERGGALPSEAFARLIGQWREAGREDVAFLIGGADGHGAQVSERADLLLSLGPATWPHLLARAMLLEQIYRSFTILAGHPYHRA